MKRFLSITCNKADESWSASAPLVPRASGFVGISSSSLSEFKMANVCIHNVSLTGHPSCDSLFVMAGMIIVYNRII